MVLRMAMGASTTKRLICVSGLLLSTVLVVVVWWVLRDDRQARAAADFGLDLLVERITPKNYKTYGLNSYSEVSKLALGRPLEVFYVSDDELTEFGSQMKLRDLIRRSHTRMYPVVVAGQGRAIIRVTKYDTGWTFDSIGEWDVARNLIRLQERTHGDSESTTASQIAIDVPSMNLCFAVRGKSSFDEDLRLTPLNDRSPLSAIEESSKSNFLAEHPDFDASAQGEANGRTVFTALSVAAREREGFTDSKSSTEPSQRASHTKHPEGSSFQPLQEEGKNEYRQKGIPAGSVSRNPETGTKTNRVASKQTSPQHLSGRAKSPRVHEVGRGECLAKIAQKYYGKQIWRKIYYANQKLIRNPDLIFPGQRLFIPPL